MKFVNILGRVLGFIAAIVILISVFITTIEIKALNISIYSMSLFEYNRVGSAIIIVISLLCLVAVYHNKGFLVSILSFVFLVLDFYTAGTLNTGSSEMDTSINKISFLFGDVFSPVAGFALIILGSILLFFSGVIMRKSFERIERRGQGK